MAKTLHRWLGILLWSVKHYFLEIYIVNFDNVRLLLTTLVLIPCETFLYWICLPNLLFTNYDKDFFRRSWKGVKVGENFYIQVLAVMATLQQSFLTMVNAVTTDNDHWQAIILSAGLVHQQGLKNWKFVGIFFVYIKVYLCACHMCSHFVHAKIAFMYACAQSVYAVCYPSVYQCT